MYPPRVAAENPRDPEFTFSAADFERVRKLIYQRAGISLHAGRQAMVYSRLSRRLRDINHSSFADYLQWLEQDKGPQGEAEWQEFVNRLTTNLTAFFREDHHFPRLTAELSSHKGRHRRIWCNAASTGATRPVQVRVGSAKPPRSRNRFMVVSRAASMPGSNAECPAASMICRRDCGHAWCRR